jgi:hypothetical protein
MLSKNLTKSVGVNKDYVSEGCGISFVLLLAAVGFGMLFMATAASATPIYSFSDAVNMDPGAMQVYSYFTEDPPMFEALMIRDQITGVDSSVTGRWSMGFRNSVEVIGYADCIDNGWLNGFYSIDLGSGNRPTGIWLIHDVIGDGIGEVVGGELSLGVDDVLYTEANILFGPEELQGANGIGLLPAFADVGIGILPHMVVVIPEPATITILTFGALLLRRRFS